MFLGTYTPKLDDKGRLTLPAKFRDELRGGLMITKGQDHCLYVFTREAFAEMATKVASAPLTSESARAFQRNLFSGTDEQNPDAQGRIAITPELRRYAGLTKDCVVIGAFTRAEIWDAQAWQRYQDEHEDSTPRRRRRCCPGSSEARAVSAQRCGARTRRAGSPVPSRTVDDPGAPSPVPGPPSADGPGQPRWRDRPQGGRRESSRARVRSGRARCRTTRRRRAGR